jgi:hypothetical protein
MKARMSGQAYALMISIAQVDQQEEQQGMAVSSEQKEEGKVESCVDVEERERAKRVSASSSSLNPPNLATMTTSHPVSSLVSMASTALAKKAVRPFLSSLSPPHLS